MEVSEKQKQDLLTTDLGTNGQNQGMDAPVIAGRDLVAALLSSTGLPEPEVGEELSHILETAGAHPSTVTMEELRSAMLLYLEATLGEGLTDTNSAFGNLDSPEESSEESPEAFGLDS